MGRISRIAARRPRITQRKLGSRGFALQFYRLSNAISSQLRAKALKVKRVEFQRILSRPRYPDQVLVPTLYPDYASQYHLWGQNQVLLGMPIWLPRYLRDLRPLLRTP